VCSFLAACSGVSGRSSRSDGALLFGAFFTTHLLEKWWATCSTDAHGRPIGSSDQPTCSRSVTSLGDARLA
jgi:hypothetical protein